MILVSEPKSIAVSYFSAFLIAGGAFVPPVIFHSWHNSNAFDENGRAFRTGALTFMANVSGELFFSTNLFPLRCCPKSTDVSLSPLPFRNRSVSRFLQPPSNRSVG